MSLYPPSSDVLAKIDRLAGARNSRSALIERALRRYLLARTAINARDLEKINHAADRLNAEAADVVEYTGERCHIQSVYAWS